MANKSAYSDYLNDFSDNFYEARKILLFQDPFYAQMLYQCAIEMTEEVGTISVREEDGCVYIIYSEKWVNSITPDQVVEAIKHVLSHLIFGHLTSEQFKDNKDDKKLELAEDLAVNTTLVQKNLPEGFETPGDYKLEGDLSTYEYYGQLPEQAKKQQCKGQGSCARGCTGNCGTHGDGNKKGDNHDFMTSTVSKSQMQNQVKQMVQQAYKKSGDRMPSNTGNGISQLMHFLLQPSEIPWHVILRNFVSFSSKIRREPTWKRPNRRFGEDFQGKKKIQSLHIFVAIDESGSVADKEWEQFVSEIDSIHKSKLATITICKFTAEVEKVYEFTNIEEVMQERFYGGTNFQCFFNLAEEMRPDCVIVLTDGYNTEGDDLKYNRWNSVLFCLTPNGRKNKNGKNIVIKKINDDKEIFW